MIRKSLATASDAVMCGMMNLLQWRLRHLACSRDEFEAYLNQCETLALDAHYPCLPMVRPRMLPQDRIEWESPVQSDFPDNNTARARLLLVDPSAPTLILLHALMSANKIGYLRIARRYNARGWNVVIPHLPFHYSRVPQGHTNGSLAITANLIRNGETLRQAVMEVRQLMSWFRDRGSREFGLIGTSLGGWIGALTAGVEADFRFLALIQPIVNVDHAIWENPGALSLRTILRKTGIERGGESRHAHLSSPLHLHPRCGGERIVVTAGKFDSVSRLTDLEELARRWQVARLITVDQGHFGYAAMRETLQEIDRRFFSEEALLC